MTVEDAPTTPVPQERSLLKAHKALPRRPQEQPPTYGVPALVSLQGQGNSFSSHQISDPNLWSGSPLEDPILPTTGAIVLPPTPPKNPFDTSDENAGLGLHVRKTRGMKFSQSPGTGTPRNQRSPPTPDITPPREPLKPSVFDQSFSKRVPSSRTESFSTAREHQPLSDEETGGLPLHSANLTRNNSMNASRSASTRDFGLGLGIKSDEEGAAARDRNGKQTFLNFDGGWGDKRDSPGMDWNDQLMKNVTVRRRTGGQSRNRPPRDEYIDDPFANDGDDKFDTYKMGELNLEGGGETKGFTEQTPFPVGHTGSQDTDDRRFSSISMVVEAMVVDTPPQRRRTLRHTIKKSQLRGPSPDRGRSVSNPETQNPLQGRRNSKSLGKPRRTVSAAASVESDGRPQQEIIPVVVIPERRSSLSAPTSKPTRTYSLTSASVQTRTLLNTEGVLDTTAPRRRRTLSDSIPLASKFDRGWERDFNPVIPQRRSSLSAPTSRNVSRTTSLTSESIKPSEDQQNVGPANAQPPRRWSSYADTTSQGNQSQRNSDDPKGPPLKKLASPRYSQFSEASKTPEVIEATAVSIFPHNNESILVVQQSARNTSSSLPFNPPTTTAPETPPTKHQETLSVESPLKNPRKPPPPPAFKVIPPTPQVMTPAEELNRQLPGSGRPSTASGSLFSGPLSHVRRALSNRRRPEGIVATPAPAPKGVDGSTQTEDSSPGFRRPSLSEADRRDSGLHPFWKPRGFWDDLDDDDNDYLEEYPIQRNSVPIPASRGSSTGKRISFSISDKADYINPQRSSDSLRIQKNQKTRRSHRIPGLGLEFEYIGWRGIQERMKEAKARREHEVKEKQRSKLRQQIGAPKVIDKSVEV
ncbi:MAG: hypothetical protein M1839_004046 [Geoglossum umbratile]|nr:MAG: hypothetical protein M1839_004046 [Geoglossum umbratile]